MPPVDGHTGAVNPSAAAVLTIVLAVGAVSLWVWRDARSRDAHGRPVVATVGGLTFERPEVWAALCLLVALVFVPMYLVARKAD